MNLTSLIITAVVIIIVFLIMKFMFKTLKIILLAGVAILVLGIWFYGFSGFFDKVSDVKEKIPELGVQKIAQSITGCTADIECAYVTEPGDCRMVAEYCNNMLKEDNYKKILEEEVLEEDCNRTSIQLDYTIDCTCKLHKEREGKIKQWFSKKIEEKAGYTYCWKKD